MAFSVGPDGARRIRPVMNVTPLVDVVLVLLIIFMVITPLLSRQFSTSLPLQEKADTPPSPPGGPTPVVLTLDRDGRARLNDTAISDDELAARLPRVMAALAEPVLFFSAHDDVPHGRVVEVMDRARGHGARRIAVLTERLEP